VPFIKRRRSHFLRLSSFWASVLPNVVMMFVKFPVRPDVQAHLVINCVIGAVVLLTVIARLVARKFMGSGIGLDDLLIVCALVSITSSRVDGCSLD
jgi:hypothetical protein